MNMLFSMRTAPSSVVTMPWFVRLTPFVKEEIQFADVPIVNHDMVEVGVPLSDGAFCPGDCRPPDGGR